MKEMFPFVKSIVTPLLGTLWAVKFALNHKVLPAGTNVPLKFEELVAEAVQGGGGGGPGQLKLDGAKVMGKTSGGVGNTSPVVLSVSVAPPDGVKEPVNWENVPDPVGGPWAPVKLIEPLISGPRPEIVQLMV